MGKRNYKDFTLHSFWLSLLVVALLIGASFIPSFKFGSLELRQRSIISEIALLDKLENIPSVDIPLDSLSLLASNEIAIPDVASIPSSALDLKSVSWTTSDYNMWGKHATRTNNSRPSTHREDNFKPDGAGLVLIEDYGVNGTQSMERFMDALTQIDKLGRPARVAVLGDSFIEGDIITADIRELLQRKYGGTGVGFVPFISPVAGFRGTIKHTFNGLNLHYLAQKNTITPPVSNKFFISGLLATANQSAEVKFRGVSFRDNLNTYPKAKIIFINEKNSRLSVSVNDTLRRVFTPESSPHVQEININSSIENLSIRIDNPSGFIGYGVEMEGSKGVTVDNFSIRGSSGLSILKTDPTVNRQINKLLSYDLVILQYGLNAMSPSITNYKDYSDQLIKIIRYVQECFSGASVLVMSVGDRSQNNGGTMVSMPVIESMIAAQSRAARETNTAFWNTFEAMGGENSMVTFVRNNWAAKDYTHMRYGGGRVIARRLVDAIIDKQVVFATKSFRREDLIMPRPRIIDSMALKIIPPLRLDSMATSTIH